MNRQIPSRRMFLRGAGGATLALPLLPSLLTPRRAFGATVTPPNRKFFVAFLHEHGGVNRENLYPLSLATQSQELYPGHTIRHGKLLHTVAGTEGRISNVLRGSSGVLTPGLVAKTNLVVGLDYPFYLSHHGGGMLGNIAGNDGFGGNDAKAVQARPNVTIDQTLAWSPSFYGSLDGVKERSVFRTTGHPNFSHSYTWSSPSTRSGNIQQNRGSTSLTGFFDKLLAGVQAKPVASRPPIIDGVLDAYKRMRANTALSTQDGQRLDDHMDLLNELERKVTQKPAANASCAEAKRPGDRQSADPAYFTTLNDIFAAAISCGSTRVAVSLMFERFVNFSGNWHQDVAHRHTEAGPQMTLVDSYNRMFQSSMLDLAGKLNAIDDGFGHKMLDNGLLLWTGESGPSTHSPMTLPTVMMGSAGGYFKTGNIVDLRNLSQAAQVRMVGNPHAAGLTYNRLMATILHSMGVDRKEWETPGQPGYGQTFVDTGMRNVYKGAILSDASQPLPIIT